MTPSPPVLPRVRPRHPRPAGLIRLATPRDATWLDWLQDRPWARDAGWLPRVAIDGRIALRHVHVIEVNGAPAGYAIAAPRQDRRCHVTQHVIDEECWRRGLGTALMEHIAATAEAAACDAITLRCVRDALATEFWPAAGLTAVATVPAQRRLAYAWSRPLGPNGRLRLPPPSRRRGDSLLDLLPPRSRPTIVRGDIATPTRGR